MSDGISSISSDSLPPGWSLRRIDSLLRSAIRDFGSFSMTNLIEFVEQGVPFIKSESVANGHIDFNNVAYITERVHRLLTKSFVNKGDVLFTKIGAIGRVAVYDGRLGICNSNAATAKIQIDPTQADATFFAYKLGSEQVMREFEKTIISTPPRINLGDINSMRIECPPLPQQRKIARILTTVDNLIEKTEALIAKYQAIKQGMMHDLFTRGVDEHGHLRPPYEEAPELYKPSELGWIPKEWEVRKVGEACSFIVPGRTKPTVFGGDLPWITIPDLDSPHITQSKTGLAITRKEAERIGNRIVPADAVIMTCVGVFGLTAKAATDLTINQQLHAFICGPSLTPQFLRLFLSTQGRQMENMAGQTTIPYLNKSRCNAVHVLIPPIEEQQTIACRICNVEQVESRETKVRRNLCAIKTGLMQDLLTSKVRVKVDETEEVVSHG